MAYSAGATRAEATRQQLVKRWRRWRRGRGEEERVKSSIRLQNTNRFFSPPVMNPSRPGESGGGEVREEGAGLMFQLHTGCTGRGKTKQSDKQTEKQQQKKQ